MTLFWIVAAAFTVAALLFVVPPLFRRQRDEIEVDREAVNIAIYKNQLQELDADLKAGDISQDQYDKARQEIERRLLEDAEQARKEREEGKERKGLMKATAATLVVALPAFAIGLYLEIGSLEGLNPEQASMMAQQSPHAGATPAEMAQQIEMMVANLAQRLRENPADAEGWVMLGRTMKVLDRYPEAVRAFETAHRLIGDDPDLLVDYADALAMAEGGSLEGRPLELLARALELDPGNRRALWLTGTAHFERGDFTKAIEYYYGLLKRLPPDSEDAEAMRANIREAFAYQARKERGEFGDLPPSTGAPEIVAEARAVVAGDTAPTASGRVSGRVELSPELASRVGPDDTLFIFARAVEGPPMPLAIIRGRAAELPRQFTLDESMAMMPSMSLADFSEVVVGARISKSGDAMPRSGDLQALSGPVAVGSEGVVLTIDSVVP